MVKFSVAVVSQQPEKKKNNHVSASTSKEKPKPMVPCRDVFSRAYWRPLLVNGLVALST